MPRKSQYDVKQSDVTKLVKQGKNMPSVARELGVPESAIAIAFYEAECIADPSLRIDGTEKQAAKKIVSQRKEGVRWIRLSVRSGKSITEVKRLFKQETGQDPDKTWTGRGRKPAGVKSVAAPKKEKATATGKKPAATKPVRGGARKARTLAERRQKSRSANPS